MRSSDWSSDVCSSDLLAEQRVAADVPRFDQQGATAIDAATDHAITGLLAQRQRFAAEQRFIDVRAAVEHDAVDRHLLAGPHAQAIANAHVFERDIYRKSTRLNSSH